MSLTTRINAAGDPVRSLMRERFPNTRTRFADIRAVAASAETLRPETEVPSSLVGQAIDLHIWGYFAPVAFTDGTAFGLLKSWGTDGLDSSALEEVIAELNATAATLKSPGRRVESDDEQWLARFYLVLAMAVVFYRSGRPVQQLTALDPARITADALLALPKADWVDDLCALSWGFNDVSQRDLALPVVLNPTFAGNHDVGGADADLIIDGCLTEIKAVVDIKKNRPEGLYQLLGYPLLDYHDEYQIRHFAMYLARQQRYVHWSVEDFISVLSNGQRAGVFELRNEFRRAARTRP